MSNISVINNKEHHLIKVIEPKNSSAVICKNNVVVYPVEYQYLAQFQPIFFTKDTSTGQFKSIVIYGFEKDENLYLQHNSFWEPLYLPLELIKQPFSYASINNQTSLCIDLDNPLVSKNEGNRIFDKQGEQTKTLSRAISIVNEHKNQQALLEDFVNVIVSLDLLEPCVITAEYADKTSLKVNGLYIINRERLASLTDQQYAELDAKQYNKLLKTLLDSEQQLSVLVEKKINANDKLAVK